jgi:hypothetical protein
MRAWIADHWWNLVRAVVLTIPICVLVYFTIQIQVKTIRMKNLTIAAQEGTIAAQAETIHRLEHRLRAAGVETKGSHSGPGVELEREPDATRPMIRYH